MALCAGVLGTPLRLPIIRIYVLPSPVNVAAKVDFSALVIRVD